MISKNVRIRLLNEFHEVGALVNTGLIVFKLMILTTNEAIVYILTISSKMMALSVP